MAGPSTRPSTKGYSPVPMEERIDDGVEEPQQDNEADDDEPYRPSAPLLSARRGNEAPTTERTCWYHKLAAWRPFRRQTHSAWDPPSKPRSWRRIMLWTYLIFMTIAAIALGISTGVITSEFQHYRSTYGRGNNRYRYERHTRLPMNDAWKSSNNQLNFINVYPSLETSPSSACESAWRTLQYVPCHEKIWNRSWDNGKHSSLFDPDPAVYAQAICSMSCTNSINRAFQLISSMCTEEDKFDMRNYQGPFSVDPGLEDGPLGVITTIAKRLTHTCRQEPSNYYYGAGYCAGSMWEDWYIVDGMNAGNLNGLDAFEFKTREYNEERYRQHYRSVQDSCDDVYYYRSSRSGVRRWGPTVNSTTCDWCTMNWFERKLLSWEEDKIRDPKTGDLVQLPEYLKKIEHAGQRCEKDSWDRVWGRALRKYKESGDLPKDWDGRSEKSAKVEKPKVSEDPSAPFHILPVVSADLQ